MIAEMVESAPGAVALDQHLDLGDKLLIGRGDSSAGASDDCYGGYSRESVFKFVTKRLSILICCGLRSKKTTPTGRRL